MQATELKSALLKTRINDLLNSQEMDLLISHSEIVVFQPGSTILQQGKINDKLYIILEGFAVVTARILSKDVANIITLQQGNILGEVSSMLLGTSHTSVIATSLVKCLLIKNTYLDTLATFYPETANKITTLIAGEICARIINLHKKITHFMSNAHMMTRSMFSEVIKSLARPEIINFSEAGIETQQLQKSSFFAEFTIQEFGILTSHATLLKTPKNCTLVHIGEKNAPIYLVLFGAVQSNIIHDNKIAKISVHGPMSVTCSAITLHSDMSSLIDYTTCERAIVLKISRSEIEFLQKNHQLLWFKFFHAICKSFAALERAAEKLDIRLNSELYNR